MRQAKLGRTNCRAREGLTEEADGAAFGGVAAAKMAAVPVIGCKEGAEMDVPCNARDTVPGRNILFLGVERLTCVTALI